MLGLSTYYNNLNNLNEMRDRQNYDIYKGLYGNCGTVNNPIYILGGNNGCYGGYGGFGFGADYQLQQMNMQQSMSIASTVADIIKMIFGKITGNGSNNNENTNASSQVNNQQPAPAPQQTQNSTVGAPSTANIGVDANINDILNSNDLTKIQSAIDDCYKKNLDLTNSIQEANQQANSTEDKSTKQTYADKIEQYKAESEQNWNTYLQLVQKKNNFTQTV